jgi:hypothetical protein
VKILPHGELWLEDRRVEGAMYEGDTIKKTTNIGIAKVRCIILSGYRIVTIGALKICVKLLPLPQPSLRAHTDARTNPSAQRATQLRSVLARVYAVSRQNQITTTVPQL